MLYSNPVVVEIDHSVEEVETGEENGWTTFAPGDHTIKIRMDKETWRLFAERFNGLQRELINHLKRSQRSSNAT